MNGAASLDRGNPAGCRSVSGLTLPRSAGRVSTLARERPVALPRGLPFRGMSSPAGFSGRLSPHRSCLAAPVPAPVTPFDRARGAPSPWVVDGPTPVATSRRESAEPVCKLLARAILSVGGPAQPTPVDCRIEQTRFTPAVNGGILSLFEDSSWSSRRAQRAGPQGRYRVPPPVACAQSELKSPVCPGAVRVVPSMVSPVRTGRITPPFGVRFGDCQDRRGILT